MKPGKPILSLLFVLLLICGSMNAQQTPSLTGSATVPRLVNFSGKATDLQGKAVSGIAGATFAIYKEESGGSPLWLETQNIQADAKGNYTVQLGATKPDGLPQDLFSSGEARWLGVTINGGQEQPRVLLLSVPYALKAADAETIGGLPPSAFVLANKNQASGTSTKSASANVPATAKNAAPPANPAVTGKGVLDFIPMWDSASDIVDSIMFQKTSQIGINTTAPAATLDVNGKSDVRDTLTLFPKGTDPTLAVNGTSFKVDQTGKVSFVSGQTFPGTGKVTSVGLSAPSTDFTVTGSPVTKSGTLALNWTVAPTSLNTPNAIVKRDASGNITAGVISAAIVNATNSTLNGTLTVGAGANISNPAGVAIVASTSGSNAAITGTSTGTNAVSDGVDGISNSSTASGVAGVNNGGGVGVYGTSAFRNWPFSAGVYGVLSQPSSTGSQGSAAGVWGDTNLSSGPTSVGVLGTADEGVGGLFLNNPNKYHTYALWAVSYDSSSPMFIAYNNSNGTYCYVDEGGNINCTGQKHAIVPVDGGKRKVALSSIESPENWFEDFGSARLVNGVAVIGLDPDFIQAVNTEKEYNVFLTPYGDCKGLYVTNRAANSFEVHELGGGTASLSFGYRITAIRRKYETVRFEDHTNDPDPKKMLEQTGKDKPAPSSAPASLTPALPARIGVPVAELTNK